MSGGPGGTRTRNLCRFPGTFDSGAASLASALSESLSLRAGCLFQLGYPGMIPGGGLEPPLDRCPDQSDLEL